MKKAQVMRWLERRKKSGAPPTTQKELAVYLEVSPQAVNGWPKIVPLKQALKIERLAKGNLPLGAGDYE